MKAIPAMLLMLASQCFAAQGASVPLELARPDDNPGNSKKPVKVYILAGQSNMVGMGSVTGSRAPYPSIFLSADPAILPGMMAAGLSRKRAACRWHWKNPSALANHGIYQSAEANAKTGAVVAVHKGVYAPKADYSKLAPAKTATVALGTVAAMIPTIDGPCTPVVTAFLDVPVSGSYMVHVGSGSSTYAVALVDGKEVYRREPGTKPVITKATLEAGKRHPVTITYFKSGSAAIWLEQIDLVGTGDLVKLTKEGKQFQYLIDDEGKWTERKDVYFQEARLTEGGKGSPLSATSNNGKTIGPEVGFGYVMGTFHDEQVLLIKTSIGNRSLDWDFRPPSSGQTDKDGADKWEGVEYRLMVKGVRETLANIATIVPGYAGQGYEMAGFGWWQAHKDRDSSKAAYEKNLVNLINDIRKEFKAPKMPVVVATGGFHGYELLHGPWKGVWEAQMAVGDPKQHPEFAGTVATIDTRDFWREIEESPKSEDYHYNRNPETYLLTGEAMGRAMVRMQGGEAVAIPKSDREAKCIAKLAAEAAVPAPTEAQLAASLAATKPMLLDGLLASFFSGRTPRGLAPLKVVMTGSKPPVTRFSSKYLDDMLDTAVAYLQTAGITEYDWKPFGGNLKDTTWDYVGFDLPNNPYKNTSAPAPVVKGEKTAPTFEVSLPAEMTNWFMPEFDLKKAAWKRAPAPFGMRVEETWPEKIAWVPVRYSLYSAKRPQPKTVIENDVLLMRKTLEMPALKDGYRYRIIVEGSIHDNSGEGYAIYVNGKLLAEDKTGVTGWRTQGLRGSHIWTDFRDEFKGGKVTIAVANFPMNNWNPKRVLPRMLPLSVWMEEMKIPTLDLPDIK